LDMIFGTNKDFFYTLGFQRGKCHITKIKS